MNILCDTSCVLMLIRIAPRMFLAEHYRCCTINVVRHEIFRTQRFVNKYPWRIDYKDKIRCLSNELTDNDDVSGFLQIITNLDEHGVVNEKTGRDFDLSYIDRKIIACALANGCRITSGDNDLKEFAKQQFGPEFKGSISPLGMINGWIQQGIIKWNNKRHEYLADWNKDEEHSQPKNQKIKFKKLTGKRYPGS